MAKQTISTIFLVERTNDGWSVGVVETSAQVYLRPSARQLTMSKSGERG